MLLSGSLWRKVWATAIVAVVFVALYETTMLDSKDVTGAHIPEPALIRPPEPGERLTFGATAYCKGLVTAAGVAVQGGIAAADPALLPIGSLVEVDSPDSRYDGIYSVLDTGPEIKGPELDIYMWSCHEALRFGRKRIQLTVLRLGWNPRATAPGFMDRLFKRLEAPETAAAKELPSRPLPLAPR
jgi:3D (Asp-Asp-Asp) domain-containing protein